MIGVSALLTGAYPPAARDLAVRRHGRSDHHAARDRRSAALAFAGGHRDRCARLSLAPYLAARGRRTQRLSEVLIEPDAPVPCSPRARQGPISPPRRRANPTHHLLALIVVDLVLIVAGSVGMVQAALTPRRRLAHPERGARLPDPRARSPASPTRSPRSASASPAGARRWSARRSTATTINLGAGVILPSLFVTFAAVSSVGSSSLHFWLVGAIAGHSRPARAARAGCDRAGGAMLIGLYFAFVAGTLVGS